MYVYFTDEYCYLTIYHVFQKKFDKLLVTMGCRLSQNYKKLLVYKKHCNGFICTVKDL